MTKRSTLRSSSPLYVSGLLYLSSLFLAGCVGTAPAQMHLPPVGPPTRVAPTLVPTILLPATAIPASAIMASATPATLAPAPTLTDLPPLSRVDLLKGPDVIYTGIPTEMKIFWQGRAGQSFRVDWGMDERYGLGSQPVSEYDPENHLYAVTLSGLAPATRYAYRVVVNNQSASGTFRTLPPQNATRLKFISYGDTRTTPATHDAVAAQVLALLQADPEYQTLVIHTGDLVTDGALEQFWDSEFFDPSLRSIRAELADLPLLPVMGNHEANSPLFARYFPQPYAGPDYRSFDAGPAHFTLINQYTDYSPGSVQYTWLEKDLASSDKPWKIVTLHEPGWSAGGGHANNTAVQTDLQPLFEKYDVRLVLGGHNHYYARALVDNITHLTIGTGGAPLYQPESNMPHLQTTVKANGYLRIEIDGDTLTGWFVDVAGQVRDTFTIQR